MAYGMGSLVAWGWGGGALAGPWGGGIVCLGVGKGARRLTWQGTGGAHPFKG